MTASATLHAPRTKTGERFPNVTGPVTTVLIWIGRNDKGSPTEIEVSTAQPSDACVFFSAAPPSSPERPREIVWAVNGLRANEAIHIRPKPRVRNVFGNTAFEIRFPDQLVSSGPVRLGAHAPRLDPPYHWEYSIALESPRLATPLMLDPVIIVDEDP